MTALLCAILSGLAFGFSLPPYNQEYLAWGALAPLLWASVGRRPSVALGLGLLAGLVAAIALARWSHDTPRLIWAYVPFLWVLLLFAAVAMTAGLLRPVLSSGAWVAAVTCTAMTLEWATSWLPMPVNIALTQYRNIPLIQVASVAGIWGVSLLLWLANAAIADAMLRRKAATRPLCVTLLMVGVVLAGGMVAISRKDRDMVIQVAAIQDFDGASRGANRKPVRREGLTLTASRIRPPPAFVVWSEECLRRSFHPDDDSDRTRQLAKRLNVVLVTGYIDDVTPKPHNCAAVIDSEGAVSGTFQKQHLYLSETLTNIPGSARPAVDTDIGRIGAEVCFDSFYTGITRGLVASGAQMIALPNYDPPTPHGTLHYLHSAMLPFRAVENGVPFVRSDPSGLSQVIDKYGRVVAQGALYRPEIVSGAVTLGSGRGTLFTRAGDWLAWLCILGAAGILSAAFFANRRAVRQGS